MRLLSLNVGLPREVDWHGRRVTTGVFKRPISGPAMVRTLNVDGDRQADLSVHGGGEKAVYVYPSEHYAFWRGELPGVDLPWGAFGENFTTSGLLEDAVYIGDRFRVGEAEMVVTQPRLPCYKLGVRLGRDEIVEEFLASRRTGFYLAVEREGTVGTGDAIEHIGREQEGIRVADVTRVHAFERDDLETLQRALSVAALPEGWKKHFRKQIEALVGLRSSLRGGRA